MKVWEFLPTYLEQLPGAKAIRLHEISLVPPAQGRAADDSGVKDLIKKALEIRMQHRIPFWEMVLLLSEEASPQTRSLLLDSARVHQPKAHAAATEDVPVADLSPESLKNRIAAVNAGHVLVVSSRVEMNDGSVKHIPMLDFRTKASDSGISLVREVVSRMGMAGAIFISGNSYHFYGNPPMLDDENLRRFLGLAILYTPFVDGRWVGHQLIEGACALRISGSEPTAESPTLAGIV